MNKEEFAERITLRQRCEELTEEDVELAHESGLVVIYGGSEDLVMLEGAIDDELDGPLVFDISALGILQPWEEDEPQTPEDAAGWLEQKRLCKCIEAKWSDAPSEYCWTFETEIPHATFEIIDGEDGYCLGIVIDMKDLNNPEAHDFGWALDQLKAGGRVAREGWDKDLYLELRKPDEGSKIHRPCIYLFPVVKAQYPWVASYTDMLEEDWVSVE